MTDMEDEARIRQLQESVDSDPNNPSYHFDLGLLLWKRVEESKEFKEKAVEHLVISAKLNPNNGAAFRLLGHYYSRVSVDSQRASKCYQRAVTLNPDDFEAGEALCDLLDDEGKESLEIVVCRDASEKSPRAFWAFRRLGYLQVHQKKWSEAVQSLQHAIRGYPTCADLWEALGLAYQRLGMFTAAIKSYGRAIELEDSRFFALVESGNILLMLGSCRKGIEQFRQALEISPHNVAALYGLASGLLGLSKECVQSGAFHWGTSLLEEASEIVKTNTSLAGNNASSWKLHGDIQLAYAKCFPWVEEELNLGTDEEAFRNSILSWRRKCLSAAIAASRSYQRSLHLAPWQANIYTDIAISLDLICSLEERSKPEPDAWQLSEKMCLGSLLLEGDKSDFWVALACLSDNNALKQHALVRGLQLDVSLAVAWAYLGKIYRKEGEQQLAKQAFDRARSIDPSLALPWAGMSVDIDAGGYTPDEAYESSLRAVQILPLAEFQIGLGKLAALSGHLSSPLVFGAIRQAVQRAPHCPESHNLNGLVCEARFDYHSAVAAYKLARLTSCTPTSMGPDSVFCDISINLARSLLLAGNALDAAQECELLKKEGLLDGQGLQVYALSLWKLGKNDLALSMARNLAASVSTMKSTAAAVSINLIFKLVYHISGMDSAVTSILKMPRELLQSSKISFVVSAIHALDRTSRLDSIVSITRRFVTSHEEITEMHSLIALSKQVRHGSELNLEIQNGVNHLKKALHTYPNSSLLRNEIGRILVSSKEWKDTHRVTRCVVIDPPGCTSVEASNCAYKILGAAAIACYACGMTNQKFSFPTCEDQFMREGHASKQMQKWLHQVPWNHDARFLLLLNVLQKAREERFPHHLCGTIERLLSTLLDEVYSKKDVSHHYQKFQLLLCASEISFQAGDHFGCIKHATNASRLLLPNEILFFSHLLLCRAYAVQEDLPRLQDEYMKCLQLKTDYHIGWICLKLLVSRDKHQIDSNAIDLNFKECLKESESTSNLWMAIFELVRAQISIRDHDYLSAQEAFARACLLARADSCVHLCHGAICMELARQGYGSQFLSLAASSLRKAQGSSVVALPIVSAVLAQTEASLGSKAKWEKNMRLEWFSWPPEMRPAELYFQMSLLAMQPNAGSDSASNVEFYQSPKRWVLRAIHLNPSCLRYWRLLLKLENCPSS